MKMPFSIVILFAVSSPLGALAADSSMVRDTVDLSAQQTAMTDRALAFTGFGVKGESSATLSESAVTRTIADTIVPFVEGSDGELPVWEVVLGEVKYTSDGVCSRERTCTVWLDTSGAFLQAHIQPIDRPEWPRMPSKNGFEDIFARSGITFHGLCLEPPTVTIDEILRVASLCRPCRSAETVVWCLMLSDDGGPAEACWCIVGRGVPFQEISKPIGGEPYAPNLKTNYMCVFKAGPSTPIIFVTAP